MTQITAAMVKELREATGAGMMDAKNALTEAKGNMEEATKILRKKGLAAASKKAGRITAEGVVQAYVSGNTGVLVEVNCETDFVSRNDVSQKDLDTEREIARDAALRSGKPENIVEKMVTGKMEKFYGEACLLEQPYIRDDKSTVSQHLAKQGKEHGCDYVVTRFERNKLG